VFKLNPIATNCTFSSASFYPTIVGSFYSSCESSTPLFYTAPDNRQALPCIRYEPRSTPKNLARNQPEEILLKTRLKQESIASSAIPPELFAATSAITKNSGIYDRNRALHHKILAQRDRHAPRRDRYRSARSATRATPQNENVAIGRTKAQNPRFSAQKKGNIQRHETLTDRSLQAFLPAIAARTWDDIAHRYNLEKAAQVGTRSLQLTRKPLQKAARSTQLTGYQARSFWQWIEPPPDIPIRIPQGAASLQKGGAL